MTVFRFFECLKHLSGYCIRTFISQFGFYKAEYFILFVPVAGFLVLEYNYLDRHSTGVQIVKFETQNHPKTRFRDPSITNVSEISRSRLKFPKNHVLSRNHSIPPILSQLLRLQFECRGPKVINSHVKRSFIQGFPVNSYFKRMLKETENISLKVIRNVLTRHNSTQCYATTCSLPETQVTRTKVCSTVLGDGRNRNQLP